MSANIAIQTRDLTCGYGSSVIIDDVNLDLPRGQVTCILGKSGCGKSTLMRQMLLLDPPLSGAVRFDGEDVTTLSKAALREWRGRIGMLFQGAALFGDLSLIENAAFPLLQRSWPSRARVMEIARRNLDLVGLAPWADHHPDAVSGGMRKRAGIARALALDPPFVFLDEPGAGLDPVTAADLDALIVRIRDTLGTTLVVVTHELLSIERIADHLVMLGDGGVLATGPAAEVRAGGHPAVEAFFGARELTAEKEDGSRETTATNGLLARLQRDGGGSTA